jgi:hypothetical protein
MIISSKFDGRCKACGGGIKQGDRVVWIKGVQGVTHISADVCASAPKAAPVATVTANAKPMADFLNAAKDRGLKFPKVQFLGTNNSELLLKLAGAQSKNPGAVFVFINGNYSGSIAVDGTVRGSLARDNGTLNVLATIAGDPAQAAKAYGMLTGNCSFCRKDLTDEGSVEVGYGPVCAKKYGLPHKAKGTSKAVTFEAPMSSIQAEFDAMTA